MSPNDAPVEDAALYIRYGEGHLRAGEFDRAESSYSVALQFEARSVPAMTGLGHVHLLCGRLDEARQVLMRALAIAPEDARARKLLGEVHARAGRLDQAAKEFQRAAECEADSRSRRPSRG